MLAASHPKQLREPAACNGTASRGVQRPHRERGEAVPDTVQSCIIIIEDDQDNAGLFERSLRREGFTELHIASDPFEGLRLCETLQPAVIVLDLHMPGLDGFDFLGRLRSLDGPGRLAPVLVVSSDDSGESRQRVQLLGAQGFLVKPVNFAEFRKRVRALAAAR